MLFTGFSVGQLAAAVVAGWVVDTRAGHTYLAASLLLGAAGSVLMAGARSLLVLAGAGMVGSATPVRQECRCQSEPIALRLARSAHR